jgi:hypothetical protein
MSFMVDQGPESDDYREDTSWGRDAKIVWSGVLLIAIAGIALILVR